MKKCVICGGPCRNMLCGQRACRAEFSRRTIANSFKKHGGQITQFRKTNGMHRAEVRALVSTKLRAMGWKPPFRGGNGTGPTCAQKLIACALGWNMEVAVPTKMPRYSGYPTCYKLDVANTDMCIGVEVDGGSHRPLDRQAKDEKKDAFLAGLGWKVFRFTNHQVETDLHRCVSTILKSLDRTPTSPAAS